MFEHLFKGADRLAHGDVPVEHFDHPGIDRPVENIGDALGAAFICADLDLVPRPRAEHASYIASWLKALKDDKRAIFTAAAHAQRAADYLAGLQPQTLKATA